MGRNGCGGESIVGLLEFYAALGPCLCLFAGASTHPPPFDGEDPGFDGGSLGPVPTVVDVTVRN